MNKKAFTLIELLSVIVLLSILITFAFFTYTKYLKSSRRHVFEVDVKSMESAVRNAFNECHKGSTNAFCTKYEIPESGETVKVLFSDLVDSRYIDEFKNPYNKDIYCDTNSSYILVTRKDTTDKSDISFEFEPCLICGNDQDQARSTMARILKKKGVSSADIISCTNLSQNQIDNLD